MLIRAKGASRYFGPLSPHDYLLNDPLSNRVPSPQDKAVFLFNHARHPVITSFESGERRA
jgi:hypothetical protein